MYSKFFLNEHFNVRIPYTCMFLRIDTIDIGIRFHI